MFKVNEILKATQGRLIAGSKDTRIRGISIDSRTIKQGDAFIAIRGNNFDGHDFIDEALRKGACCIIAGTQLRGHEGRLTKERKVGLIEVDDTIEALGDIARFRREKSNMPVIAITASAGKTTVKEMLSWVLSRRFKVLSNQGTKNNHIGVPLTLLKANTDYDMAVLELGTNHFGEIENLSKICKPNIGVIVNIGPAHLEYFKTIDGVFKEKYTLMNNLENPRIGVLNADDGLLRQKTLKKFRKPLIFGFGIKHKSDFSASHIKYGSGKLEFCANGSNFRLNTPGYNNIYNALAAIAVARICGMDYKDISRRLSCFTFPQNRLNLITLNNVRFIDDTYNSNPLSLSQALDALHGLSVKGRKIFVMGDMLELGDSKESFHSQAGLEVVKVCDAFVTVGKFSKLAASAAKTSGFALQNIFTCESVGEARDILFNKISPNKDDIVLVKGSRGMKMEGIFKK